MQDFKHINRKKTLRPFNRKKAPQNLFKTPEPPRPEGDKTKRLRLILTVLALLPRPVWAHEHGRGHHHHHPVAGVAVREAEHGVGAGPGATDRDAGSPTDRPISPKDILATMYHLLGIDPHTRIPDRGGSMIPIVPESADVVSEMLA